MKNDPEPRLEPLGLQEMGRIGGGYGWTDSAYERWLAAALNWLVETAAYAPASSYAYGKVGYT